MTRNVAVFVPDLFFAAKIAATAEAAGVSLTTLAGEPPAGADLVILDLGAGVPAMDLARRLKSDEATRAVPIVGFYSHVDAATREAAQAAGVDQVLPRSAFVARLADLLRGA